MQQSLKALYTQYSGERSDIEQRAEEYAKWTLPYLMPINGDTQTELQVDWQSLGAQVVNHLGNKLMVALFSPGRPFFKLEVDDTFVTKLEASGVDKATLDEALARAERDAMKAMGPLGLRTTLSMVMQQLIVTGNCLLRLDVDDTASQAYNLRDYVVRRDPSGRVLCIIMRDRKSVASVPGDLQQYIPTAKLTSDPHADTTAIDLYTGAFLRTDGKYEVYQSFEETNLPESVTYEAEKLPFIPLTWKLPRGWDYGVGLVEDYSGDFNAMSVIAESMNKAAAVMCDIKGLVDPSGVTDVEEYNNADTGEHVSGREGDIVYPTMGNKVNDLQFAMTILNWYEKRIGQAFLLNSAVTRDAERVTAEEMRIQANELETSQAGIYSWLSETLQLPLSHILMEDVSLSLVQGKIEPMIITGIDSLSRTGELDSIMMFITDLSMIAQIPPDVLKRMDIKALISKIGAGRGVEYNEFMLSDDEVQDNDEAQLQLLQAQEAAMAKGKAVEQ